MSSLWVSHSSDSTGQAITLEKVVKIRTFKQNKDGRAPIYRMVFDTDIQAISQVTWDFATKTAALIVVERIVRTLDPLSVDITNTQIYKDLARGFE